jgi:phage anti-repressor protein/predicted GIY-YIG superfamily endonuclease
MAGRGEATKHADVTSFLKKYTPVSATFIDEFLSMYTVSSRPTDFVVDLDVAARWLATSKENLKKTLVKSYSLGMDYDVRTAEESREHGKGRLMRVTMTADCFKTLCMQSRTPKAAEVRAYFLAVEAALFRYRVEIADAMSARIGVLERNQRPAVARLKVSGEGVIYVIRASGEMDSLYKIGRTKNLLQRMRSHGSAMADSLEVVYIFKTRCVEKVESCMKVMLKEHQYRKYKEVYQVDMELLKSIISKCDDACMELVYHKTQRPSRRGEAQQHSGGSFYAVVSPLD